MRKQYHFRRINQQFYIWDVDRLISLTQNILPKKIPLSAISELNESYWYSNEGDVPTCKSIAEHMILVNNADLSYPIILCPEGKIMDGMHRVVKAYLNDYISIHAYQLKKLPEPDFINVDPQDLPYEDDNLIL
ncbi:hypothetical protein HX088_01600 [Empedobacter sp. 225-1]|uniref:hypothetical protein n=1 Tax=Empedobacter sp. 225-1 TaxID=2746725 RepID=UPI002576399B|nr:hypothetical protein [Empedobacter sp. 225-1]MDM1521974.1 hypothetical protein [Empedobacter sp. 225-1]